MKFEGIPETFASSEEDGAIQRGNVSTENTKAVLTDFFERVLGIEDAKNIEFQVKKGKWKRKDHYCAFLKIFRPRTVAQMRT